MYRWIWLLTIASCGPAATRRAPAPTDPIATLGATLYFDPRLSASGAESCNSCHDLAHGGASHTAPAGGHDAPTLWNVGSMRDLFWWGGATTLEQQLPVPLADMAAGDLDAMVGRIAAIAGYRRAFHEAYGAEVSLPGIVGALAAFERTLVSADSPLDRYLAGDRAAMSAAALRGWARFRAIGCAGCHAPPTFAAAPATSSFRRFPIHAGTALARSLHLEDDPGRMAITDDPADRHAERVPTLRNITATAPYFHNGATASLDVAIRVMAETQLGRALAAEDVDDLHAFLDALTGAPRPVVVPAMPR